MRKMAGMRSHQLKKEHHLRCVYLLRLAKMEILIHHRGLPQFLEWTHSCEQCLRILELHVCVELCGLGTR
jgi:hypothetical protein